MPALFLPDWGTGCTASPYSCGSTLSKSFLTSMNVLTARRLLSKPSGGIVSPYLLGFTSSRSFLT
uniref:Uncharacterized protein n=1 Tax=Anguilla anguilla TaxID=7936 RepID=A0A0E9SQF7_ANGAN